MINDKIIFYWLEKHQQCICTNNSIVFSLSLFLPFSTSNDWIHSIRSNYPCVFVHLDLILLSCHIHRYTNSSSCTDDLFHSIWWIVQLLDTLPVCQDFNRSMCNRPTCRFVHLTDGKYTLSGNQTLLCMIISEYTKKSKRLKYVYTYDIGSGKKKQSDRYYRPCTKTKHISRSRSIHIS